MYVLTNIHHFNFKTVECMYILYATIHQYSRIFTQTVPACFSTSEGLFNAAPPPSDHQGEPARSRPLSVSCLEERVLLVTEHVFSGGGDCENYHVVYFLRKEFLQWLEKTEWSQTRGKTDQYLIRGRRKRCLCTADKHIKLCFPSTDYKVRWSECEENNRDITSR